MIYTHVLKRGGLAVRSPLDWLSRKKTADTHGDHSQIVVSAVSLSHYPRSVDYHELGQRLRRC
jgi:hypothetical protein